MAELDTFCYTLVLLVIFFFCVTICIVFCTVVCCCHLFLCVCLLVMGIPMVSMVTMITMCIPRVHQALQGESERERARARERASGRVQQTGRHTDAQWCEYEK